MKLPRRKFLHLAAGAAALPAVSRIARAQTYPSGSVRMIVPYGPGGPTDVFARLIAQKLTEKRIVVCRGGSGRKPKEIVALLNREIVKVIRAANIKAE